MKKILITGSEGFVGEHLWKELEGHGYVVYGTSLLAPFQVSDNVFQCDITDFSSLSKLISDLMPEGIIHLAGYVSPKDSIKEPEKVFHINIDGTRNLLDAVKSFSDYRPRILLIGSAEEFGKPADNLPFTEESPLHPNNPYAESKVKIWAMAQEYIRNNNFDIVSAIPFNHTGPGQRLGFIAPDVASQVVEIEKGSGETGLYTGNVDHKRNISDVRDVVRAYRLLLEKGRTGERYIVCADESIKLKKIVEILMSLSTKKILHKIDPSRSMASDVADVSGSHTKITLETGWQPRIPIEKTLNDLLDWYRSR